MSQHKLIYTYNPLNQSDEELLENFVIRKHELNKIVRELKNSNLKSSAQNFLIEGQRGTGKTSLLMRIRYEIQHEKSLSYLVPVQFAEEQYGIFDLCRLWEKTAEILEEIEGFEGISEAFESKEEEDDYHQECFLILEKYLKKCGKRLVLLIDNFGDLLDNISDIEAKRLRDIFHSSTYVQIIAATAKSLEHTYHHDKPFFEFFKSIRLEGLNKEETNTLLKQLSTLHGTEIEKIIQNQASRIETMRRLTGGIPRTIVLLFEVFLDESADIFEDLEGILEKVTPLYKHRMDDLPKQQKAIMDTIALNWDGISSKEIVAGLKKRTFDTKSVSAQLKLLEKNGLITSQFVDKKNKIYFIKERFFNIWYLMRYGKKSNKSEVLWLVKFLRSWCSDEEIFQRTTNLLRLIKENKVNVKGAEYMAYALRVISDEISERVSSDRKNIELVKEALKEEEYDLAIKYSLLIKTNSIGANGLIASIFEYRKKDFKNAIKYYELALELDDYESANHLGKIYYLEYKDTEKAIQFFKIAVEKKIDEAMLNLALVYYALNKHLKEALLLSQEAFSIVEDYDSANIYALMLMWNNHYDKSFIMIRKVLAQRNDDKISHDMLEFSKLSLAKQQYHSMNALFQEFPKLQKEFKPIYYALMTLMKEEFPKEYLKMGSELKETVDEILLAVEEYTKVYN